MLYVASVTRGLMREVLDRAMPTVIIFISSHDVNPRENPPRWGEFALAMKSNQTCLRTVLPALDERTSNACLKIDKKKREGDTPTLGKLKTQVNRSTNYVNSIISFVSS